MNLIKALIEQIIQLIEQLVDLATLFNKFLEVLINLLDTLVRAIINKLEKKTINNLASFVIYVATMLITLVVMFNLFMIASR